MALCGVVWCAHRLVFVESVCTDEKVIAANVRETKLKSPDYQHEDEDFAVADFLKRIEHYVAAYETLDEVEDVSYIKLIDVGRQLITNRLSGYLNGRILFFLQVTAHLSVFARVCRSVSLPLRIWEGAVRIPAPSCLPPEQNLNISPRPIWLSRHGESQNNALVRAGSGSRP